MVRNGEPGRLILYFNVVGENGFEVSKESDASYNITCQKEISVLDCITGCEASIDFIDGKTYKFTVKQGTKDGFVIRLKDLGLRDMNGRRGFLDVVIRQKMPKSLSKDEKKAIAKLRSSKNFK